MKHKTPLTLREKLSTGIRSIPPASLILIILSACTTITSAAGIIMIISISLSPTARPQAKQVVVKKAIQTPKIVVDIEGAVPKPGIFELPYDSRFIDALNKAEGLDSNADRYYVAKTFNLAKKLVDEDKIYIPFFSETQTDNTTTPLIDINTASQTELELLPKIGPVTAQKIIENRPYGEINELVTKQIVGQKTYDLIQSLITL